jgi:hypothetical protein
MLPRRRRHTTDANAACRFPRPSQYAVLKRFRSQRCDMAQLPQQKWANDSQVSEWAAHYFPYHVHYAAMEATALEFIPQAAHAAGKARTVSHDASTTRISRTASNVAASSEPFPASPSSKGSRGARLQRLKASCSTTLTPSLQLFVTEVCFVQGFVRKFVDVVDPARPFDMDSDHDRSSGGDDASAQAGSDAGQLEIQTPKSLDGVGRATSRTSFVMPMPFNEQQGLLLSAANGAMMFNNELMPLLKAAVRKMTAFFRERCEVVSAAVAACIDASKTYHTLAKRNKYRVEQTFQQAYYTLAMLQQYCDQSYLALVHFVGAMGRLSHQRIDAADVLGELPFAMTAGEQCSIAELRHLLLAAYASRLCDGDEDHAERRLLSFGDPDHDVAREQGSLTAGSSHVAVGIVVGALLALAVSVISLYATNWHKAREVDSGRFSSYLFALSGIPIFMATLFALNVVAWERCKVNFAFSFHLHPFGHMTSRSVFIWNGGMAVVWLACMWFFLHAVEAEHTLRSVVQARAAHAACNSTASPVSTAFFEEVVTYDPVIPSHIFPYLVFPIVALMTAARALGMRGNTRQSPWFLRSLWHVVATPMYPVSFSDFFICEQLVSCGDLLWECQWFWCVFSPDTDGVCFTGRNLYIPVLAILPSFWRTAQSLRRYRDNYHLSHAYYPHLLNATKYSISMLRIIATMLLAWPTASTPADDRGDALVVVSDDWGTAFIVIYLALKTVDTTFKVCYETWVEYGVLRPAAANFLLRDTILFPQWTYYASVAANVLARYLFVGAWFVKKAHPEAEWVFPVFSAIEVSRRVLWNFYRVEHDQVDNTENYKTVRNAPLLALPHASSRVDWQITREEIERRFQKIGQSAAAGPTGSPGASSPVLNARSLRATPAPLSACPSRARSPDTVVARPTLLALGAFYAQLPPEEHVEVLRTVYPPGTFPFDDGDGCDGARFRTLRGAHRRRRPLAALFPALDAADQARALLLRIGQRTADEYLDTVAAKQRRPPSRKPSHLFARSMAEASPTVSAANSTLSYVVPWLDIGEDTDGPLAEQDDGALAATEADPRAATVIPRDDDAA